MVIISLVGEMLGMADGCGHRGFSQTFYREKVHEKHFGFKDLESFMQGFWEMWACSKGKLLSFC